MPTLHAHEEAVDLYHASEYLKEALDSLMTANSPTTDQRCAELRHRLRHERIGAEEVLAPLKTSKQPAR